MYYIFLGANSNLLDALDEDLDLRGWECDNQEIIRLFLRSEHLKSCILSYNSIEDYILEVVVFAFNLKGKKIASKIDFRNKRKNLYYKSVINRVKNSDIDKEILSILKKFHNDEDVKKLRQISNELKHSSNIKFKGLPSFTNGIAVETHEFNSKWFESKPEDLEDIAKMCIRLNKKIKVYVEKIYNKVAEKYNLSKI